MSDIQRVSLVPKKAKFIKDKLVTMPLKTSNMQKTRKRYQMSEGGMIKRKK